MLKSGCCYNKERIANIRLFHAAMLIFCLSACNLPVRFSVQDGVAKLRQGKIAEAKTIFLSNLQHQPTPQVYDGIGCVAYYEADYELAEASFLRALELDSNYLSAAENLTFLYEHIGDKNRAAQFYPALAEYGSFRFLNNYAEVLYNNGENSQAKKSLLKAYQLSRNEIVRRNLNYEKGN